MNPDPKSKNDSPTATGHTPGSAEGVDQSEGEDQSQRDPAQANSSTQPVESGADEDDKS